MDSWTSAHLSAGTAVGLSVGIGAFGDTGLHRHHALPLPHMFQVVDDERFTGVQWVGAGHGRPF